MNYIYCVILSLCFSCKEDVPMDGLILRIKENKISCAGYEGQTECYLVQKGSNVGGEQWDYFYEQIDGFEYEVGFVYTLLVAEEFIEKPQADAPHVKYSLIRQLPKVSK